MSGDKKGKSDFGKRGREPAEPAARKATALQRLGKMGSRWWAASGLKKKDPPRKGFKQARLRGS